MSYRLPTRVRPVLVAAALAVLAAPGPRAQSPLEPVDLDAVHRIKTEGFARSAVMEILSYLTDVHGPRLTNSPGMRAAAEYVRERLVADGLSNVAFEEWGPFGRGWENERTVAHVVSTRPFPLLAFPKAWTPGTGGPIQGEALRVTLESREDFAAYEGRLEGKVLLVSPTRDVKPLFEPPARRFSGADLDELSRETPRRGPSGRRQRDEDAEAFRRERMAFFVREGAVAILEASPGDRGDNGSVRVQGFAPGEGSREPDGPAVLPQLVVSAEHYGRIVRRLERDVPVTIALDVRNRFYDETLSSFNIIAEIPGTDRADEVVMIGAHFDSWHAGSGTVDNGAGSAVVMEAMRILKATGLPLRRTVRLALWTGEEQGLLGSRAYVKAHFADPDTMALEPEHEKLAAYFNTDNGSGAFRGVYLQGHDAVAPIFEAWIQPFRNLGMTTLAIRNTGGTDHLAFDGVGLPGFQFIQDPLDYGTWAHHTNQDLYERAQADDLKTNAVIMASFAYHAANRAERLPRKPLPSATATAGPTASAAR